MFMEGRITVMNICIINKIPFVLLIKILREKSEGLDQICKGSFRSLLVSIKEHLDLKIHSDNLNFSTIHFTKHNILRHL